MKSVYPITPVAKPRMTRSDKWKKRACVLKYRDFADRVREHKIIIPEAYSKITFVLPLPVSYSKKKQSSLVGQPHQIRPDLSNLLKALEDAVYTEDSHIWNYAGLSKVWGVHGQIRIESTFTSTTPNTSKTSPVER